MTERVDVWDERGLLQSWLPFSRSWRFKATADHESVLPKIHYHLHCLVSFKLQVVVLSDSFLSKMKPIRELSSTAFDSLKN